MALVYLFWILRLHLAILVRSTLGQNSAPSEGSMNPLEYLKTISDISIPRDLIEPHAATTFYTIIVHRSGVEAAQVLIKARYSEMQKLKDALTVKIPIDFPGVYYTPDAWRCRGLSMQECNEERRQGLEDWLKAALRHLKTDADESNAQKLTEFFMSKSADARAIEEEKPMEYLNSIKSVTIPSDLIVKQSSGTTMYSIQVHLDQRDSSATVRVLTRYSRIRVLNDNLALQLPDVEFPGKYKLPDSVRCRGMDHKECVEERRKQLEDWLNAVLKHVKNSPVGANSLRALQLKQFLHEDSEDSKEAQEAMAQEAKARLEEDDAMVNEQDRGQIAWRKEMAKNNGGECAFVADTSDIKDWVASPKFTELERRCPNFGQFFGSWGNEACPNQLADIRRSIVDANGKLQETCFAASGGLGGIKPIICSDHVLKVAKDAEVDPIFSLLYTLEGKQLARNKLSTLLGPVCRVVKVTHPNPEDPSQTMVSHFTIVPNLSIKDAQKYRFSGRYDLKGNWGYEKRVSEKHSFTLKDFNFRTDFPDGIDLHGFQPDDGESYIDLVRQDSEILAGLGHLDYSIFVHVVQIEKSTDFNAIRDAHKKIPLAWGSHKSDTYVMAFGIIDLFMRHDKRNWGDQLGLMVTALNTESCTVLDIDPLLPAPYRVRFARMVGYHVPGPGEHAEDPTPDLFKRFLFPTFQCGACYYRGPKYQLRSFIKGEETMRYTYFKSSQHTPRWNTCEWTAKREHIEL